MTGGGKPLHYWQNLIKIINKFSILQSKTSKILSSKGAILIEFAFCLPVMMVLIYYIYDLNRLKRYYSQTEFIAQQMASMIQNISQNRENKAIKLDDLRYCVATAFLSIYPRTTMFRQGGAYVFGHKPRSTVYYVKGLAGGKASCVWKAWLYGAGWTATKPTEIGCGVDYSGQLYEVVKYKTNADPKAIHPQLKIQEGEVKIIIETSLLRNPSYTKNTEGKFLSEKQSFRFYLINPNGTGDKNDFCTYFNSVVIFTPRPGLFSETAPS